MSEVFSAENADLQQTDHRTAQQTAQHIAQQMAQVIARQMVQQTAQKTSRSTPSSTMTSGAFQRLIEDGHSRVFQANSDSDPFNLESPTWPIFPDYSVHHDKGIVAIPLQINFDSFY